MKTSSWHEEEYTAPVASEPWKPIATALKDKLVSPIEDMIADPWMGEPIADSLEAVPNPDRFMLAVKQVNIKRQVGSILLPDQAVDDQKWTSGLAIVVKVGKAVYQGKKFEDMGLSSEDAPKPQDLIYFQARAPHRIHVDGELYMYIPDDAVLARIDRKHISRVKFTV